MLKHLLTVAGLALASLILAGCQQAESYPSKPIEYVVHSSAGGGTDIFARAVSDIMAKEKIVPQTMNVVNKSGGSGAVAMAYVAEKAGDPYTIFNVTSVYITTPMQGNSKVTYKDFTPIANLVTDSHVVVVNADSPYKTLQDLIDAAKSGKKITQGGGSVTSSENMAGYLIKKAKGVDWEFVSFNSGGDAVTALLGNHVDLACPSPNEAMEHLRAGKVRYLAVDAEERLQGWPDVPAFPELGIPALPASFRGIVMPKDVPPETAQYWETTLKKMTETQRWKDWIQENGLTEHWVGSKDFNPFVEKFGTETESIMREMGFLK